MDENFVGQFLYSYFVVTVLLRLFSVREMTANAMGGDVTFRKALQDRLNLIRPSQAQIQDFIVKHPPSLTPKIQVGYGATGLVCPQSCF